MLFISFTLRVTNRTTTKSYINLHRYIYFKNYKFYIAYLSLGACGLDLTCIGSNVSILLFVYCILYVL